ncbi:unnamed protein product [Caenorhabditis auriculariae]|uniref:G-protein coupled receptors family 1 profile domain-containing protein n=1 Tax=Caenorhabditis auriculariae TaxID=2777116 RepID=A0A8S1GZW5_9PELO|nr:unnamed protein product [Caenorhabditis auriculariae]
MTSTRKFVHIDWDIPSNYSKHLGDAPGENEFETIVGLCVVCSAALGIFANIAVMLLSFGHVKGDFRHFVANLAFVDILCGFIFAIMGYINMNDEHRIPSHILYYLALAFYGSFGVMICALVPISISRVLALTRPSLYTTLFTGRRSMFFCLISDMLPVSLLYLICLVGPDLARLLFYMFATITVAAYIVAFATNYIVFRIVARHIRVVQNLRDQARLLETRQIAIATLGQAFIPLVCQVPAFLTLSSVLLLSEPITNGHVSSIIQLWLANSPLLDAIITILVIKQYRKECLSCASAVGKRMWKSRKTTIIYTDEKEAFETRL